MEKNPKYYTYSLNAVGMVIAILVLGVVILAPPFIRDTIKTADITYIFIIALAFWFILHEIIHGLSYRMSKGVTNRDIAFGAKLEKGMLICACWKPITKGEAIRSLLAPLVVIGFLTLIIGIVFNFQLLVILSVINVIASAGDILITLFILRLPKDMHYMEDSKNRIVIITHEDISSKKSFGLTFKEVVDDFEAIAPKESDKIGISIWSYVIIGAICLYTLLSYLGVLSFG
jgi:hypothetical protein